MLWIWIGGWKLLDESAFVWQHCHLLVSVGTGEITGKRNMGIIFLSDRIFIHQVCSFFSSAYYIGGRIMFNQGHFSWTERKCITCFFMHFQRPYWVLVIEGNTAFTFICFHVTLTFPFVYINITCFSDDKRKHILHMLPSCIFVLFFWGSVSLKIIIIKKQQQTKPFDNKSGVVSWVFASIPVCLYRSYMGSMDWLHSPRWHMPCQQRRFCVGKELGCI